MTPAVNQDALSLALAAGGVAGSLMRAWIADSRALRSKKAISDVVVGFLVGFLWPLYPLIAFPASATTLQKAIIVAAIAYLTGDLLLNGLKKLSGLAGLASKTGAPIFPKTAVLLALVPLLTGCAGVGFNSMSPEQLEQWSKNKDATCTKITGVYMGATVNAISVSVDKGIPPGAGAVSIDDNCKTTITAEPKPVPPPVPAMILTPNRTSPR